MTTTNFSLRQSVQCWQCNAKHARNCSGTKSEVTHSVILNLWLKFTDVHWLVPFIYPITTPRSCKSHKLELNVSTVCTFIATTIGTPNQRQKHSEWLTQLRAANQNPVSLQLKIKLAVHTVLGVQVYNKDNKTMKCPVSTEAIVHVSTIKLTKKTNSYCVLLVNFSHPVLTRHKMQWTLECCTSKDAQTDIQKSQ